MANRMNRFFGSLGRFAWTAHNLIAHPVSEILYQVGFEDASEWLHDITTPEFELYIVSFREAGGGWRWISRVSSDGSACVVNNFADANPLTTDQVRIVQSRDWPTLTIKPYQPSHRKEGR